MKEKLEAILGAGKIKHNMRLAPYSTFKTGGPAEYYFEAHEEEDILRAIKAAHALKLSIRILGGASNIVIDDRGIRGLVVRNMTATKKIVFEDNTHVVLHVSSGYSMTRLAKETAEAGLAGFEHHLGLPGTVGGALYMNSKWVDPDKTYYVGDNLVRAELVDLRGNMYVAPKAYFQFAYDYSILQKSGEHVVWIEFSLRKDDPTKLIEIGKTSLEYRKKTQPFGVATSGCFFKNVNGISAGKMIDELGLKGYRIGGAYVSDIHANFILNDGTATTEDVEKLIAEIKKRVKERYHVDLVQEVSVI